MEDIAERGSLFEVFRARKHFSLLQHSTPPAPRRIRKRGRHAPASQDALSPGDSLERERFGFRTSELYSSLQRPRKYGVPMGVPQDWRNWTQIQGLPPTPPRTGCFGMTTLKLSGISSTSTHFTLV